VPTYQYACTACDDRLEVVQRFTDDPLTRCPACGGPLRKVFSSVGVLFKGPGFYRTDSRATSGDKKKAPEKAPAASTGDAGATKAPAAAKSSAESAA
jgi:putative FmdB family regulatory protein